MAISRSVACFARSHVIASAARVTAGREGVAQGVDSALVQASLPGDASTPVCRTLARAPPESLCVASDARSRRLTNYRFRAAVVLLSLRRWLSAFAHLEK